jgi:hydrogenase small subunit
MPFMDEPPGGKVSTTSVRAYGKTIRTMRKFTQRTLNKEPKWRERGPELKTGYQPKGR